MFVPLAGFKPTNTASERPQTHDFRARGHWDWHLIKHSYNFTLQPQWPFVNKEQRVQQQNINYPHSKAQNPGFCPTAEAVH